MSGTLADWATVTPVEFGWLLLIAFAAGLVRGFSGFALSAMVMATAVTILPPVELIPICWWLEMCASVLMMKGGWADADRKVALGLVLTSAIGVPFGLTLTMAVSPEASKVLALGLLITLAAMQLAKIRLAFLATNPGLYGAGFTAGIATGLAGVGGMVVALYVLAREAPARQMRGSLVLFLFGGSVTSMATLLYFGVMDWTAVQRGLILAPAVALGVLLGQRLFTPRLEPYYKPFCLSLLLALAGLSLIRTLA